MGEWLTYGQLWRKHKLPRGWLDEQVHHGRVRRFDSPHTAADHDAEYASLVDAVHRLTGNWFLSVGGHEPDGHESVAVYSWDDIRKAGWKV